MCGQGCTEGSIIKLQNELCKQNEVKSTNREGKLQEYCRSFRRYVFYEACMVATLADGMRSNEGDRCIEQC
jgi:tRNA(Ile)-lysidine synthase TilS/MesJ